MVWTNINAKHKFLVRKHEERSFGRPRHREEDNIKMNHKELGFQLGEVRGQWQACVNTLSTSNACKRFSVVLCYPASLEAYSLSKEC